MSSNATMMRAINAHLGYEGNEKVSAYSLRRFYIQQMRKARIDPEARFYLTDQNLMALRGVQQLYDPIQFDDDMRVEAERLADHLAAIIAKP